jgi:RNA polymerase sigma-70 factor (ECF subfamily)
VDVDDPYPGLSDRDMAALFDGGDAHALNALCRRHYHTVFRFAYRLTQNRPEAEDCTQETFVRFVRNWPRWRARDRGAGPWLTAIAKNVVADHWQKQLGLTKVAVAGHDVAEDVASTDNPPDQDALEREFQVAVRNALQQMEPPCRDLIELVFQKGLTQKEAADVLGTSHDAVRKRYQRCLKRLQADLEGWGA